MVSGLEILVGIRDAVNAEGDSVPHYLFALTSGDERLAYCVVDMQTSWWDAQQRGLPVLAQALRPLNGHGDYTIVDGRDMNSQGVRHSCAPIGEYRLGDARTQLLKYLTEETSHGE